MRSPLRVLLVGLLGLAACDRIDVDFGPDAAPASDASVVPPVGSVAAPPVGDPAVDDAAQVEDEGEPADLEALPEDEASIDSEPVVVQYHDNGRGRSTNPPPARRPGRR